VIVFNGIGLAAADDPLLFVPRTVPPHLSLAKDTPIPPVTSPGDGAVVAILEVGGLHQRYEQRPA
jgi:hypothetical protein